MNDNVTCSDASKLNNEQITQSTSQQMCVCCRGSGKDRKWIKLLISLVAGLIILDLAANFIHPFIITILFFLWLYELYGFWSNECKVCKGTGFVTITTTTITK